MEPFEALGTRLQERRHLSRVEAVVGDDHASVRNGASEGLGVTGLQERDALEVPAGVTHLRIADTEAADDPHGVVSCHWLTPFRPPGDDRWLAWYGLEASAAVPLSVEAKGVTQPAGWRQRAALGLRSLRRC